MKIHVPRARLLSERACVQTSDAPLLPPECFTIWLSTGTVLTYIQSPIRIPNPQSPIPNPQICFFLFIIFQYFFYIY